MLFWRASFLSVNCDCNWPCLKLDVIHMDGGSNHAHAFVIITLVAGHAAGRLATSRGKTQFKSAACRHGSSKPKCFLRQAVMLCIPILGLNGLMRTGTFACHPAALVARFGVCNLIV